MRIRWDGKKVSATEQSPTNAVAPNNTGASARQGPALQGTSLLRSPRAGEPKDCENQMPSSRKLPRSTAKGAVSIPTPKRTRCPTAHVRGVGSARQASPTVLRVGRRSQAERGRSRSLCIGANRRGGEKPLPPTFSLSSQSQGPRAKVQGCTSRRDFSSASSVRRSRV